MIKLLETYKAKPTIANAKKIKDYSRKHPFASCLLPDDWRDVLMNALRQAIGISK